MGAMIDMAGWRVGRLMVIRRSGNDRGEAKWFCHCDCGASTDVPGYRLRKGETQSCGCLHREVSSQVYSALTKTHGMTRSPEYQSWSHMIDRCENEKSHAWKWYGGRGIKVCSRWRQSFEAFAADMGSRPSGMTLDRINVDGDYEPANCRWSTPAEQNRNRRKKVH